MEPLSDSLTDHLEMGVAVIAADGRVVVWNDWLARMSRVRVEDAIGRDIKALFQSQPTPRFFSALENATQKGIASRISHKLNRYCLPLYRDGESSETAEPFEQLVLIRPFNHETAGACALMQVFDVSQAVHREKILSEAKRDAERASRAKSDFLSSMSHELRTPLNSILGFSQVLSADTKAPLNDWQLRAVKHINDSGEHLLALINDILDLAKSDAGQLVISIEPLDPLAILHDGMALVAPLCEKQRVTLNLLSVTPDCPQVRGDYTRLKQALLNLLTNAIKYNVLDGKVDLSVEARENGFIRFRVADTGKGIPEEQQKTLFEPFIRGDDRYKTTDGVGIGLSITKRLIELMGGTLSFSTELDKGSEFWFDLPAEVTAAQRVKSTDEQEDLSTVDEPNSQRDMRVLYVEDNPANQILMRDIVARLSGTDFLVAETGQEGLDLAKANLPDIILLDISLPDLNGFEVLRRLRRDPATRDTPVVAVTANAMPKDIELGRQAGFTDYITKPVKITEIHEAILAAARAGKKADEDASDAGARALP